MNKYEIIECLARDNAKSFRPLREEEADDVEIPYFVVKKVDSAYNISMHNYAHHDNAPRMAFYCDYLQKHVFPNIEGCDLSGVYPIELYDTYTYLPEHTRNRYNNALVFAKDMSDRRPCLVPDPYMLGYYGGRLNVKDEKATQDKDAKVVFRGSSTGNTDPRNNMRIKLCSWANQHAPDITDFGITNIVQMDPGSVREQVGDIDSILKPQLSQKDHYNYKYILSIDGNTACWDRMMWIASSQSILMKYKSRHMLWYYPLFIEDQHYVGVDMNTMHNKFKFCEANPGIANYMVMNANAFVSNFITPLTPVLYLKTLFEEAADNKA
jgi:hypothetical protein